jgi:selenocysteine-specific elongation factor
MDNCEATLKNYTTVGVTGHIDHGKTSLVGVLTGVDTDTHPEEKRRGITIDLGFAAMQSGDHTFAFIDAPGHQKYLGNLLAGVSAVDVGLLVVACDQGIQAQTLEHAAILKTLGVPKLIVALSRVDLAEERQDEVIEEIEVFLSDYGFEEIPVVKVSSVTKAGIDELKAELHRAADSSQRRSERLRHASFRMPIDRVLHVPGRGLVVAGTIWTGQVAVGDILQVAGTEATLRVREIEVHGEMVSSSSPGIRSAMNLAGSTDQSINRGDELVAPGSHQPASTLVVEIELYPEAAAVSCPTTVQLHAATASCAARLTGIKQLQTGSKAVVVVEPECSIVATFEQACLFRRPYPIGAFAGGRVLAALPHTHRKKKDLINLGKDIAEVTKRHPPQDRSSVSDAELLQAWTKFHGEWTVDKGFCESQLGILPADCDKAIQSAAKLESMMLLGNRLVFESCIQNLRQRILSLLESQAKENDDDWSVADSVVQRVRSMASAEVIRFTLAQLIGEKAVVESNGRLAIASEKTLLSKKQRAKMDQLLQCYAGSRTPPTTKEVAEKLGISVAAVNSLARHATQQSLLMDLGQGLFMAAPVFETLCAELQSMFNESPELAVANIRDGWSVTRKHAIPLLEFCDREQLTTRNGDVRIAGPELKRYGQPHLQTKEAGPEH